MAYTHGATGNISVRAGDGFLMTPTGMRLDALNPARLSELDADGVHAGGDPPTKEAALHLAMYASRPKAQAIIHLHGSQSVALSLLPDLNPDDVLPAYTAYFVMRVGRLRMLPYFAPGDLSLAKAEEAPGRGYHWGMATPHANLPRGTRIKVGVSGTLRQILFGPAEVDDGSQNLVGAITTCMGNVGAANLRQFQETEIIIAPSIKSEGKLFQMVQNVGMAR
ncbi:MAG: aldolase [Betaproteobacteria bacterium]|nr:aldolase [Betaproteobacteria bacterium]